MKTLALLFSFVVMAFLLLPLIPLAFFTYAWLRERCPTDGGVQRSGPTQSA